MTAITCRVEGDYLVMDGEGCEDCTEEIGRYGEQRAFPVEHQHGTYTTMSLTTHQQGSIDRRRKLCYGR